MNRIVLSRRGIAGVALAAVAVLTMAACGKSGNTEPGESKAPTLTGDVKVDGSSTVAPLSEAAATLFKDKNAKVNVSVGTSGTGGGFTKFCNGETDISDASRKIKADPEVKACDAKGIKSTELHIANDALSVVVSKDNTWAQCLTVAQLKKIWDAGSTVKSWNEVDPAFPNEPLKLYGPGTDSGTFDFFTAVINGKEKQSRKDYTASEDDNVLVSGVAGAKGGLGYFGYTYYEENMDKLKIVKIDGGKGCVEPSVKTAQDGSYAPLSRPLFIYVSNASYTGKAQVKAFIDFYVAKIDDIVKEAKFVPLTAEQKTKLSSAHTGIK